MKLSEWAKENNKTYISAWRAFGRGEIPNAYKDENNNIIIKNSVEYKKPSQLQHEAAQSFDDLHATQDMVFAVDMDNGKKISKASSTVSTRSNRAAYISPIDRYANVRDSFLPFRYHTTGYGSEQGDGNGTNGNNYLTIRDVLLLCYRAYWRFPIVKNLIETMVTFSASKIYLTGGTQVSRDFFEAYFNKIKLVSFTTEFFREFWRSSNCFIYKNMGTLKETDVKNITKVYGGKKVEIPLKYIMLDPIGVEVQGAASFVNPVYYKVLNGYELERLRNPQTPEDEEILASFDPKVRAAIKNNRNATVNIKLNAKNLVALFNAKQSYESFGVPMVFSALDALEAKTELLKIDQALAKTAQQAFLLVTMGYEDKEGNYRYNPVTAGKFQDVINNESTYKGIVADFTTKMEFIIPQVADILDPKKYEVIQDELKEALGHILFTGSGGEKFANQQGKIKVFIEKIRSAREIFINEFLVDEIKRISLQLGFKVFPKPHFEDIDLDDSNEYKRVVTQLATLGFLTPEETFEAIETKRLPTKEESVESQKEFKGHKDAGLYEPNNGKKEEAGVAGRPAGTKRKQSTKKISPIGTGAILESYVDQNIRVHLMERFNISNFNEDQEQLISELSDKVFANNIDQESIKIENLNKVNSIIANYIKEL